MDHSEAVAACSARKGLLAVPIYSLQVVPGNEIDNSKKQQRTFNQWQPLRETLRKVLQCTDDGQISLTGGQGPNFHNFPKFIRVPDLQEFKRKSGLGGVCLDPW